MRFAASIVGITTALYLSGCTTTGQTQIAARPVSHASQSAAVVTAPPSRAVVTARPVVVEEVIPETNDVYISAASNSDIVFVGGSTYIWAKGPDGRRHRHFYSLGDRRREVFRRRDNLRSVVGHRPERPPAKYAGHGSGRQREDARRPQRFHANSTPSHNHSSTHRQAADDQSHHIDSHHSAPKPGQSVRDASAARNGVRHHPAPSV